MSSDKVLEFLVRQCEETGLGYGITLCVNGLVVYGNMIPSKKYYDSMENMFKENSEKGSTFSLNTNDEIEINMFNTYMEKYRQFMKDMRKDSEMEMGKYLHLEHASIKVYNKNSEQIITGSWRCKISSIDAFSIGYATINKIE